MGNLTEIIISAVDQASGVFDQIGNSADSSFNQVSTAADQASVSMDEAGAAADTSGVALESIDSTTLDQASSSATEAANSLDEAANSAESAGTATESINSQAINEAASSASSLGASFDEVSTKADEAANSASNVGTSTNQAATTGTTGMLGATVAIAGMTVGLEGAAEWSNTTNASFEKMSNAKLPEAELRAMVAAMTNVNFPTEDALLYIRTLRQTGVTATDSLNSGAIAFNQIQVATGVSNEEVVKFSNSMVAMGMDMNNVPSSFNAIAYANANMVGGFSTYANWMQKYDSTFKEMGLNIDQTAVLISAATQKFGGGRAAYTGLNEAIKASNGDLSILEQQLGMQPGALANASEATAAYSGKLETNTKITNEHTTILQQAKAYLSDLATQYGDVIGVVGSVGGIIGSATGVIMAASTAYTAHATSIMANATATSTNTAAENSGIMAKVRSTASTIASTVATGAQTVATYAVTGATWLWNAALNANPIGIIIIAIMLLVAALAYLYTNNETVRNAINWLWAGLQQLGGYIGGAFMGIWAALSSAMGGAPAYIMGAWSNTVSWFQGLFTSIMSLWGDVVNYFNNPGTIGGAFLAALKLIYCMIAGCSPGIIPAIQLLFSVASAIFGALSPIVAPLYNTLLQVSTFIGTVFTAVWRTLSGVVMAFITYIGSLISIFTNLIAGNITVGQALQQVWAAIQVLLAQVFMSIILGIGQFSASLINYGIQAASGLLNAFIAYVSQLPGMAWGYFLQFLSYLASLPGSAAGYAASVGSTIVSTIGNYLSSLPGQMYSWGMNALNQFVNGIINTIPGLRAALETIRYLFPSSPPKEGPLSKIKYENMERFGSDLTESMGVGLEEGAGNSFDFISGSDIKVSKDGSKTGSGSSSDSEIKEVKVIHVLDFINVPTHIDTETLKEALKGMTYDLGWIDTLIKTLTYGKTITKANLGA